MTRKLISFDWAIKKLLRSKANFGILEGFLSELLFTEITIVEILESESDREHPDNKRNQVDIKVRDSQGQLILIEVQYSREQDYLFRILFSSAKCVVEHLDKGSLFSEISKVISVNILYFEFCQGDDYIYHGTTEFLGLHNQHKLELNAEQQKLFHCRNVFNLFPEYYIINIRNFNDIATTTLDEWVYFLKNEEIKDDFHAKGLKEAKEKLDILKLPSAEKIAYDAHIYELMREGSLHNSTYNLGKIEGFEEGKTIGKIAGIEEGKTIGKIAGIEEGMRQKAIELATNMHKKGFSVIDIAEITGLSESEVQLMTVNNNT